MSGLKNLTWAGALLLGASLAACSDQTTEPLRPAGSSAHLGGIVDIAPTAPGYFLPDVYPDACFKDRNSAIADSDLDWLADHCEVQLAHSFAPIMQLSYGEACYGWEPFWATKYFTVSGVVRIAYLASYYRDCGHTSFPVGLTKHNGDAEMVVIDVKFNSSTHRWEFQRMWTSAHYGHGYLDFSRWSDASEVQFPQRHLGYPRVWVAASKHANYHTREACEGSAFDVCLTGGLERAMPVVPNRNVGSRYVDHVGCVYSTNRLSEPDRCEGFYLDRVFLGWRHTVDGDGEPGKYRPMLMSDKFETYNHGGVLDAGPGPVQPTNPYYTLLYGPDGMEPGGTCEFYAHTIVPDATITWYVNSIPVATGTHYYHTAGPVSFIIHAFAQSASGGASAEKTVTVSSYAGGCAAM